MSISSFRKEINGLRAIAVISVVLFHFGVFGFSGGFVGVDIFFVISGFLMTSIVMRGLESNAFSFFDFYLARARRIIPALFFLTIVLLVIGWFYFSPDDYYNLAREIDRAVLFLSNNYFYKKSGYFDPESHERLLLHTWTLSVEWQFYILYPILLFAVKQIGIKIVPKVIFIFFILSFAFSVIKSYSDPSYAFYILPSRAWEMFLGGLVYYAVKYDRNTISKKWFNCLGFLLIFLSIVLYSPSTLWPGFAALLPTTGAALIIYSGINSFITNNGVFQKLGDWSYSIYLWHWPLAVSILIIDIEGGFLVIVGLISLSVILGALSFFYIENPIRRALVSKSRFIVFVLTLISLVVILAMAKSIRHNKGYIDRLPEHVFAVFNQANNKFHEMSKCQDERTENDCVYGSGELGAIVIGDSHAMSILGSVTNSLGGSQVLDWTQSGCATIENIKAIGKKPSRCSDFLSSKLSNLVEYSGVPILVVNRFTAHLIGVNEELSSAKTPTIYLTKPYKSFSDSYTDEIYNGYFDMLCKLSEANDVYVLKPVPELKFNVPNIMGRSLLIKGKKKRVYISLAEYQERHRIAMRLLNDVSNKCNVNLLDPVPYLCDGDRCYGDLDGLPVYYDDDHLNMRGSDLLKKLFEDALLKK